MLYAAVSQQGPLLGGVEPNLMTLLLNRQTAQFATQLSGDVQFAHFHSSLDFLLFDFGQFLLNQILRVLHQLLRKQVGREPVVVPTGHAVADPESALGNEEGVFALPVRLVLLPDGEASGYEHNLAVALTLVPAHFVNYVLVDVVGHILVGAHGR